MTKKQDLLLFIKRTKIFRSRDAEKNGFTRSEIAALLKADKIERLSRGLYRVAGGPVLPNQSYMEFAARCPNAVVCLLSALQFHSITTQLPREIWCAIKDTTRAPKITYPKLRVVRFIGKAFSEGIEVHEINGIPLRVYSVAKTVADLFRFRNKIGLDVAMEALREAIRTKKTTRDEIRKMAQLRGVYRVMRPYMEMEAVS
jgi:predicted transcriptional regulator of viral defense system